jgi:hypothetical protein
MKASTKSLTKRDEAKIIGNMLALVGSPVTLPLFSVSFVAGEDGKKITTRVAASDRERAEKMLRRKWNVGSITTFRAVGYVDVPDRARQQRAD